MRGLYRRGDIYWIAIRKDGKLYRESTDTTSLEEAEEFLVSFRKKIREGTIAEDRRRKSKKFADLAQDYLKWAERQRAYRDKKVYVRQLVERFGHLRLRDLNTKIIEQWQTELLKSRKPATVNRKLACLKHMVNKGVQWEMVSEYTLKKVRNVKLLEERNRRLRFLTVEECQALIDCCAGHLKPLVKIALHTGMRRGEILNLKWEQVDLKHGFILLDVTKNGERREIPIDETLKEVFNSMARGFESVYVFTDPNTGDPYKTIKRSFSTALKKAEIRDFKFHDLRHTFASQLVMNGVDITSVKELLGHKTLNMTMRYAHLAPEHKMKAVRILDNVLKNTEKVHNFSSQLAYLSS